MAMRRVHIVGRKNHGKTTLILALLEEFGRRGAPVGAIKHSSHAHDLDTPGKDSYRQRLAGANPAAIVTPELAGVFLRPGADQDIYDALAPLYAHCRLVLVEGHIEASGVKVEVWRAAVGGEPLAGSCDDVRAIVTDDLEQGPRPIWPRRDVAAVADRLLELADA